MKTKLILLLIILSINHSSFSQSSVIERNREIFDKMQKDMRLVMNDFQKSMENLEFAAVYETQEDNNAEVTAHVNDPLPVGEAIANDSYPDIYPINIESRLTSQYGYRKDPFSGKRTFHGGIDLAVPANTDVVSCGDGKIEISSYNKTNGYYIIINHGNKYKSYYGHLSRLLVQQKDFVKKGQKIALSGNTGMSTGPHIHFQITFDEKTIDPLTIIN